MTNLISSPDGSVCSTPLRAIASLSPLIIVVLMITVLCNAQEAAPLTSVGGTNAAASGGPGEQTLATHKNEFGFWAGGSLGLASALGGSRDRKIPLLIGLRYGRVLAAGKYAALEYTFDIIPVALVSGPEGGFSNPGGVASAGSGRDYVYGAGFVPVGFKLFVGPEHRVKPYLTVSSGPFYFTKQVPVPDSAHFNFISTAGGGVQVFVASRGAIFIEYRVGHLSNAGVGNLNPGFNSSTIHLGFSVFR